MHHTCGPARPLWYTEAMQAADARLVGLHWRCSVHGVTSDAFLLSTVAYCPADGCIERALLVQTSYEVPGQWRTRAARARRAPETRSDGRAQRGRSRVTRAILDALERAAAPLPTRDLVLAVALSGARRTRAALARDLGHLRRRGLIRHPGRGTWTLA